MGPEAGLDRDTEPSIEDPNVEPEVNTWVDPSSIIPPELLDILGCEDSPIIGQEEVKTDGMTEEETWDGTTMLVTEGTVIGFEITTVVDVEESTATPKTVATDPSKLDIVPDPEDDLKSGDVSES